MKNKLFPLLALLLAATLLFTACASGGGDNQKKDEDDLVLVTEVELLNGDIQTSSDGTRFVTVEADADGVWRYQISYCTHPDNANDRGVNFVLLTAKKDVEIDEASATVTIHSAGIVGVRLQGKNGSEACADLYIYTK